MPENRTHLDRLLDIIRIEATVDDRFIGQSEDIGTPSIYGGQVLGQAFMAACLTVPDDRAAHSFHAYFLRPGDHGQPVDYAVHRVRDGGSFSTRSVAAFQNETPIFEMMASFHAREHDIDRQEPMPSVPGPEGIRSESELFDQVVERLPVQLRGKPGFLAGLEYRPVIPFDWLDPTPREARASIWLRVPGALPDTPIIHQALLAYASDHGLLLTATLPHGLSIVRGDVRLASIDHALWFHRDFRIDDWLLYQIDCPSVHGNRTFCRGSIYTQDGRLVATVNQEGLMRRKRR